jgi:serine/threonine-protein kinase HipA
MIARVQLWRRTIGAVSMEAGRDYAAFQYAPAFAASGIELAPLVMPLSERVYEFPLLPGKTFHGLPGLLADSLPDTFGNALIDAWLATQGRTPNSFGAVERLCYTGTRGMGALEFAPGIGPKPRKATTIAIDALVQLASDVLTHRSNLQATFAGVARVKALNDILQVGKSARLLAARAPRR